MPTVTKENAKLHCRTCLRKLRASELKEEKVPDKMLENQQEENKDIFINITTNTELKGLITRYVYDQVFGHGEDMEIELPPNLCLSCYNKLQSFDNFRKKAQESAEKLNALFSSSSGVTKVEIEHDDNDDNVDNDAKLINNEDMYKLLIKDTLMETESVLLDSLAVATLASVEMHDPDPFDTAAPPSQGGLNVDNSVSDDVDEEIVHAWPKNESNDDSDSDANSENYSNESSYTEGNDDDDNAKERQNNVDHEDDEDDDEEELNEKINTRSTRLSTRKKRSVYVMEKKEMKNKKKRRTKKEMEEWRLTQAADKLEQKIKRRNKGTKNSFKCTQCNHCFAHKITLDAHIRKVHEGSKRPFQCDRCEKSYTFIGGLYTHIKEIHETEVRSYSCDFDGCGRIYTSFIAMQKHKRLKHTDISVQKKYVCEQCGATFNQSGNLKYHRRSKHPTDAEQAEREKTKERYECQVCQKLFHSRYTLKYHTLQLHTNDMKYECNTCGRRMAKKFMLIQHMLVHSTEKMPCEHCGKQFIRKFELEAHIRAVHMKLKPFECQYCSECFASRKTLRHHEYIHTGEKPYVCDICGQAYRQQTCLKNHRKSHDKLNAESLLAANINRTLMHTLLGPQQTLAQNIGVGVEVGISSNTNLN